ncbi:hypothetical protein R6Q57_026221 [Mikania cordata]
MFNAIVTAFLLVFHELLKIVRNLIAINDPEDKLDHLLSGLFVGFKPKLDLEELKIMLQLCSFYDEGMHKIQLSSILFQKDAGELEGYCNKHNVTQHSSLRELAIDLSSQEIVTPRKPLFMEIQGFPIWRIKQITQPINPNILSLSTGLVSSNWYDQLALKVEELTLNVSSKNYTIPELIRKMGQLKVLSITNPSDQPSNLHNLSLIQCLSELKAIRFEHVSVSSIQPVLASKNLKELSFVMCEIGDALMSYATEPLYMPPNLTNLEFDMCYDLKELPSEMCSLIHLQKLSITNCHEFDVLPKRLGGLSNLEILNLHCCTKLQELPESIGSLHNLSYIDISDCLSIGVLPEEIGELGGLRLLKMNGCGGLQELPMSLSELQQLKEVICDEETSYLWRDFESDIHNLNVHVFEDDRLVSFMKIVQ